MSLIEKVRGVAAKKTENAREAYHAALRRGDPEKIIAAAAVAGIDSGEVEKHIALIERAQAMAVDANKLPELEKAAATAKGEAERAFAAVDAAVGKLQPIADAAGWQAGVADRALAACRATVNELATVYRDNPDLLPLADAPAAVREFLRAEAASQTAGQIRAASDRRAKVAAERLRKARELEQRITAGTWPWDETNGAFDVTRAERSLRDGSALAQAKKAVEAAEKELAEAQAAGA